jgi:hypothetical protein
MRAAARSPALLLPLLLAACGKPGFDERYAEAEKSVRATAAAIDRDIAAQENAQRELEGPAAPASGAMASTAP